jgi:O-antigen ligase
VPNLNTDYEAWTQTGGLGKHPGNSALFAAVLLPILLGRLLIVEDRRLPTALLAFLGAMSVVLAGNRTLFLVVPVALAAAVLRVVVSRRFVRDRWRSTLIEGVCAVLVMVAAPSFAPNSLVVKRVDAMVREVERALVDGQYQSSGGRRLYWWRAALPVIGDAPFLGHGTGSTEAAMRAHLEASRSEEEVDRFATDNPHSTLVTEGIERGAIGVLLWVGLAVSGLLAARRVSNVELPLTGLVAGWLVLIGYGLSSSVQLSGINTAVLAILMFISMPSPSLSPVSRVSREI